MKVKNIMFFGAAAVILSAAGAMAAPNYTTVTPGAADNKIVTSKSYVDSKDELLNQDIALKQDTLVAGTNISIAADGKTISATDTTYSADGTTVALNGTTFSANTTGGVGDGNGNLVTGDQVQTAIDGAIADVTYARDASCTAGVPCALVDDGTTKKWYGMAI